MAERFKHVGLVAKSGDTRVPKILSLLAGMLTDRGIAVVLESHVAEEMPDWPHAADRLDRFSDDVDLIIVVGGDGTMLKAARHLAPGPVPLVGINLGRLGFLTDTAAENALRDVGAILDGEFSRDRRRMLHAQVLEGEHRVAEDLALNDVVIQKADGGRMIEFETWVDGHFVSLHRADGMIAATATGSTAYALSCGGPILHPDVDSLALVPICPHTLSDRPLVIPGSSHVRFVLRSESAGAAQLNWDGQQHCLIGENQTVELRRSERITTLLHPPGHDYFALLRSKLHWGRTQEGNVPR